MNDQKFVSIDISNVVNFSAKWFFVVLQFNFMKENKKKLNKMKKSKIMTVRQFHFKQLICAQTQLWSRIEKKGGNETNER